MGAALDRLVAFAEFAGPDASVADALASDRDAAKLVNLFVMNHRDVGTGSLAEGYEPKLATLKKVLGV